MSNQKDSLGDRMKGYENVTRHYLPRRIPVIIRLDGRAFHTFTMGLEKPFDRILMECMHKTMQYLCENIQGCVLGYTQSDEITLVLIDDAKPDTDVWFGGNIQKMASVAASMATVAFNNTFAQLVSKWSRGLSEFWTLVESGASLNILRSHPQYESYQRYQIYSLKSGLATFDARVFSIPKSEVCNCLIWRQQDATRNSIEAVGQAHFSHRELQGKSCSEVQDMLFTEKGINWNDLPVDCKRGACCYRKPTTATTEDPRRPGEGVMLEVQRRPWVIDKEPPIFTQDRNYVDKWL